MKRIIDKNPIISKIVRFFYAFYVKRLTRRDNSILLQHLNTYNKEKNDSIEGNILFSIIVPVFNTPVKLFDEMIESVEGQSYEKWELILIDDKSTDIKIVEHAKKYSQKNPKIKLIELDVNLGISGATNEGVKKSKGDFICLFDHDDILHKNALLEVANVINKNPNAEFIYTDEAKIKNGVFCDAFFKTDWNFEFIKSVNYITHFTTIKKTTLNKYGLEDSNFDGAQDWELFLRVVKNIDSRNIYHISKILYFWRIHDGSTAKSMGAKPYVIGSQRRLLDAYYKEKYKDRILPTISNKGIWYRYFKDDPSLLSSVNFDQKIITIKKDNNIIKIYNNTKKPLLIEHIQRMTNEVLLDDTKIAVSNFKINKILANLAGIVDDKNINIIKKMSRFSLSKNMYINSSYNLKEVHEYDYMVVNESKKNGGILNVPIID